MPGPATSAPFNTSFSPWAPASIAAIDTLRWITRLGPATGIHLAVASRHRDAPLVADEFIDNINAKDQFIAIIHVKRVGEPYLVVRDHLFDDVKARVVRQ